MNFFMEIISRRNCLSLFSSLRFLTCTIPSHLVLVKIYLNGWHPDALFSSCFCIFFLSYNASQPGWNQWVFPWSSASVTWMVFHYLDAEYRAQVLCINHHCVALTKHSVWIINHHWVEPNRHTQRIIMPGIRDTGCIQAAIFQGG